MRAKEISNELFSYRDYLRDWAAELSAQSSGVPVLVKDVCDALKIAIVRSDNIPKYKAYLSVDPTQDVAARIHLPNKHIRDFERFCIAHEVGHYLLISNFKASPKSQEEYWVHEKLCDEFARCLLVPDRYLRARLENEACGVESYLVVCRNVHHLARIPWIHVAKRINEIRAEATFFRCEMFGRDFEITSAAMPDKLERKIKIKRRSKLHNAFSELLLQAMKTRRHVVSDITGILANSEELYPFCQPACFP